MRRLTVVFAGLLITGLLCSSESYANQTASEPDVHALASSPQWLTTKVYIEGEPDTDVKASYPGVVGISMWDPQRNRYRVLLHRYRPLEARRWRRRLLPGHRR